MPPGGRGCAMRRSSTSSPSPTPSTRRPNASSPRVPTSASPSSTRTQARSGAVAQHRVAPLLAEHPDLPVQSEPAPLRAFAARIGPQLARLHQERHLILDRFRGLDGPDAAEVDVGERARPVRPRETPVPPGRRLVVDVLPPAPVVPAADRVRERRAAQIPRHPLGNDLRKRAERHRHGALSHLAVGAGRGVASNVHHARRRRPQLDGPERAVVHRPARVQGDLTATNTPAPVTASDEFTTPGTWRFEPAKSATMPSPSTVSSIRTSTGSSLNFHAGEFA